MSLALRRDLRPPFLFELTDPVTTVAVADLIRVTSGGSRLGNALPSVVEDPSFEVGSPMIRLG
jgi:hypothetical protein